MAAMDTATQTSSASAPELKHCPAFPFVGSTIPQLSGVPALDPSKTYDYWPEMTRRFGEFYTMGIPGIGAGINQTVHIIQDPKMMTKVLKSEGQYPSGAAQSAWASRKIMDDLGHHAPARIIDHGPEWRRIRTFFQTDLLSPQAARQYVPSIAEATQYASRGVLQYTGKEDTNLNIFLEESSFDMFCSLAMGYQPRITDSDTTANPEDVQFCRAVKRGLTRNTILTQNPKEMIFGKVLGIKTALYKEFAKDWEVAFAIATKKVDGFLERRAKGTLSKAEKHCYLQQAFVRQEEHGAVTQRECSDLIKGLLGASVDTTAGMTAWHLCHISMHPEIQERIREELVEALKSTNGVVTAETVSMKSAPYLHAAFRESHRLTNPAPMVPIKTIVNDVEVHGVTIPAGSVILMDTVSKQFNLVDDPERFDPDRWLPEAMEARKGTPAADLDHVLFKAPFSEGARKCPGSRVAKQESLLLMAQLILDWKMESPLKHWREIKYKQDTVLTPTLPNIQFTPH